MDIKSDWWNNCITGDIVWSANRAIQWSWNTKWYTVTLWVTCSHSKSQTTDATVLRLRMGWTLCPGFLKDKPWLMAWSVTVARISLEIWAVFSLLAAAPPLLFLRPLCYGFLLSLRAFGLFDPCLQIATQGWHLLKTDNKWLLNEECKGVSHRSIRDSYLGKSFQFK